MSNKVRVVHYGVGSIGSEVARLVANSAQIVSVAAIDADPAKLGRDLGEVIGLGRALGVVVSDAETGLATDADVVLHSTASHLAQAQPQLLHCIKAGRHIVSSCEELAYPWRHHPDLARELDDAAKSAGVTVLGTGVNPGFVMDTLVLALAFACQDVRAVHVVRVVDAADRRLPLQRKVGAGMSVDEFHRLAAANSLGHVGLPESAAMLADTLGWSEARVERDLQPVVASERRQTPFLTVAAGQVAGIRETLRCVAAGREVVRLDLEMSVGAADPRDEIIIDGVPPVHLVLKGGLHGDRATAAIMLHCVPRVMEARPGLITMRDVPLSPSWPFPLVG